MNSATIISILTALGAAINGILSCFSTGAFTFNIAGISAAAVAGLAAFGIHLAGQSGPTK